MQSLPCLWTKEGAQGLWRRGIRLLSGWGFGTRTVEKAAPVASGFESWARRVG